MNVGNGAVSYMTFIAVRSRQCGSPERNLLIPDSNITRKTNQRTMKVAIGKGGELIPSPGRRPFGANGIQSKAVSNISGSITVGENTPKTVTKERKINQQPKSAMRGHRFNTVATAATMPNQPRAVIIPSPELIHNKLGARKRGSMEPGNSFCRCSNNEAAGRIPSGPINAFASWITFRKTKI